MTRLLLQSSNFKRDLRKWLKSHPDDADSVLSVLEQIAEDPWAPQLRTHKLTGPVAGSWACRVGYDLRVVFEFVDHEGREAILLQAIGTHDQVY